MSTAPNPNSVFPKSGVDFMTNVKPAVKNTNIVVGDFTYLKSEIAKMVE